MPRSDRISCLPRRSAANSWLIGLVLTMGCAHSQTDLQDRLARRVMPVEVDAGRSASQPEGKTSDRATSDTRGAASRRLATRSRQPRPARRTIDPLRCHRHSKARHVASDSDRPPSPATSLPSDSDEATLDAIAATGKPLTLAEAIDLAFRYSAAVACPAREHRSGPRAAADRVLDVPADRRGRITTWGGSAWEWAANRSGLGRVSRDSTSCPASEPCPSASTSGRPSSWPSSRSNGCSSTSAAGWAVYEQAKLANDVARLQTERAYQTVANEVAVAYYNVLRSQALRRTAQDALRRAEEELADARKREREGVIEREVVLRSEVQTAEIRQAAPRRHRGGVRGPGGAEPGDRAQVRRADPRRRAARDPAARPPRSPIACRRPSASDASSTSCSARSRSPCKGAAIARAEFAPKVIADGTLFNFQQQQLNGHADFRAGVHPARLDALRGRSADRRDPRGRLAGPPGHGPGRVDRG